MHQPLATPQQVLRFVGDAQGCGEDAVLVVLVGKSKAGPRDPGALMAVLETGERAGSLSSGCVEAAIATEALATLASGKARRVRFGDGSDYIDIRLPCGGGMDVLFIPRADPHSVRHATALLGDRRPVVLRFSDDGAVSCAEVEHASTSEEGMFAARYRPDLRLIVAGHGAEVEALVKQGRAFGAAVELLTPDQEVLERAIREGISARLLDHVSTPPAINADRWTAVALLFHDHDWEPALLDVALCSPAFWIGAMGSRATAKDRRALLAERGFGPAAIERIKGPIGAMPSTRDPATLALSALAEIVTAFRAVEA